MQQGKYGGGCCGFAFYGVLNSLKFKIVQKLYILHSKKDRVEKYTQRKRPGESSKCTALIDSVRSEGEDGLNEVLEGTSYRGNEC